MSAVIPALSEVVQEAREDRGASREKIAVIADRSADTVRHFEKGEHSEMLDRMVNAYAQELGVDPLTLWRRAIDRAAQMSAQAEKNLESARAETSGFADRHESNQRPPRQGVSRKSNSGPRRRGAR